MYDLLTEVCKWHVSTTGRVGGKEKSLIAVERQRWSAIGLNDCNTRDCPKKWHTEVRVRETERYSFCMRQSFHVSLCVPSCGASLACSTCRLLAVRRRRKDTLSFQLSAIQDSKKCVTPEPTDYVRAAVRAGISPSHLGRRGLLPVHY